MPTRKSPWAIIIGCDRYWSDDASLTGAVHDAQAMFDWAVGPGKVRRKHVRFLISSLDPASPLATDGPASNEAIQRVINEVANSADEISRLYFYFAGHGISSLVDFKLEPAILPTDFDEILTERSITLSSITERFEATGILEQFFWIDACRNLPFDGNFRAGRVGLPGSVVSASPAPSQFICSATTPLLQAAELVGSTPGGVFSGALIRGLSGTDDAKRWDPSAKRYAVRWSTLFPFVHDRVVAARTSVPGDDGLLQRPREWGERENIDPILCTFPDGYFGRVRLDIKLTPEHLSRGAELHIVGPNEEHVVRGEGKISIELDPRRYIIQTAGSVRSDPRSSDVELYRPSRRKIQLVPIVEDAAAPSERHVRRTRGVDLTQSAQLTFQARDPLARIEVADDFGDIVTFGRREVSVRANDLQGCIVTPEGIGPWRSSADLEDIKAVVNLNPPQTGFISELDGFDDVWFGDQIGAVSAPRRSTLVAIALALRIAGSPNPLPLLLTYTERSATVGNIQCFGSEDLRFDEGGSGLIRVSSTQNDQSVLVTPIEPSREYSTLVASTEGDRLTVQWFSPTWLGERDLTRDLDLLRRLDLAERFSIVGQPQKAFELITDLQLDDPVAICLRAYLGLRSDTSPANDLSLLDELSPDTLGPDLLVLAALDSLRDGRAAQARELAVEALRTGVPVFERGLRLAVALAGDDAPDASVDLDRRRLGDQLFTVVQSSE